MNVFRGKLADESCQHLLALPGWYFKLAMIILKQKLLNILDAFLFKRSNIFYNQHPRSIEI